jgi:hypothetical protein
MTADQRFQSIRMKELMIHVERVVRPVRAVASRKLRMRRELLAHMQSAVDEEMAAGADETIAIKRAVERLGNPPELTKQLQLTVPIIQRLLLARIPVSRPVERWEVQAARNLYGPRPITLLHISILCVVMGLLSGVPSIFAAAFVGNSLTHSGNQLAYPGLYFLGLLMIWPAIFLLSCRFVMAAADPQKQPDFRQTLRRAGVMVVLQIAFTLVTTATGLDRLPTVTAFAGNIAVTVVFLIISIVIAGRVASMRRPYDEWLTLDLAG